MSIRFWVDRLAGGPAKSRALNRGARIRNGKLTIGLLLVSVGVLMTLGCGGSSSSSPTTSAGTGALYTFLGDAPACDVLSFSMFPSEMDLHKEGKPFIAEYNVTVWPTNTITVSPVIEMSALRDTQTVANLTSIPAGTYDQAILSVVVNNSAVFDSAQNPPFSSFSPSVSTSSVTVPIQPPLTVEGGKVSALELDLNLPQSLAVDSQGQLTGVVNWAFTARPVAASGTNGFGEFDNLYGFVRSVNPSSPGTGFTSSFLLQTLSQTLSGSGPALNVDLTDKTNLCFGDNCQIPVSQINQMPTGNYVGVDAYIDANGNVVAKTIQVGTRESLSQQLLAYMGPVLTVTKDPSGNVNQFTMLVRETQPNDATDIPVDTAVTVNVSSSTTYGAYLLSSDLASLANSGNLALGPSTLAPGEEVVVSGVFSKPTSGPVNVVADSISQQLQSVQGQFSALAGTPGSDNKTGGFQLVPCNGLLSNYPFMVVTDAQTDFVNTSGLSTLSPTSSVLARGLMFFAANGTTLNGINIPAGTMVLLARSVRQF